MPELLNIRTGVAERVLDEQVEGLLSSGQYQLMPEYVAKEGKRVRVISPEGKYGTIPARQLKEYLPLGFRIANESDKFAATGLGTASAAGLGVLSGATLGGSNWLIANLGGADAVEALRKASPNAYLAGELTTAVGTALLGNIGALGGAAKAGQTGLTLYKAGEAANAAGKVAEAGGLIRNTIKAMEASKGLAGGFTGALSYGSTKLVDPLARMLVAELTGGAKLGIVTAAALRGATLMPGAALEGGLWGINQAMTERALGDPREVGEMLTDIVWPSMGYSALTAGALGTAGALVGAGVSKLAKRAATKLAGADDMLTSVSEHAAARHFGWTDTQMRDVREAVGAGYDALFDESLMPDGSIFQKRVAPGGPLVTVTAKEAAERAKLAHATAGEFVGNAYQRATQIAQREAPLEAIKELELRFKQAMSVARRAGRNTAAQRAAVAEANELRTMLETVAEEGPWPSARRMVKKIQEVIDQIPDEGDGRAKRRILQEFIQKRGESYVMPFTGEMPINVQKLKYEYSGENVFGATAYEKTKAKMYRLIWGVLQDEALHKAGKTLGPAEYAVLERANSTYSKLGTVVDAIEKAAKADPNTQQLEQLFRRWGYMSSWATASAMRKVLAGGGAAGGAMLGGLPGAVIGTGAALGLGYAASKLAPRAITIGIVANKAARLGTLAEKVAVFDRRIQSAIRRWLHAAPIAKASSHLVGAAVLRNLGRDSDPRRGLKKLRRQVAELAEPEKMGQYLEEALGGLRTIAPEAALHSAAAMSRGIAEIQRILAPEMLMRQPSMQPHLKVEPDVSEGRLEEIGLRVAAVMKPLDTVEEILSGKATQPQIESFVRVYPELWAYVMRTAAMELAAKKEPLRHDQKMILARLGFRDWETPSWLPQQAAAIYQNPGVGAVGQPTQPAQGGPAFTKLARLDQAFAGHQGRPLGEGLA